MSTKEKGSFFKSPIAWIGTTYFAEGFPYTIIRSISSVFFRDKNVSLESIGLTSLYGIPWTLKFLWGPQVDRYSTKRGWLIYSQLIIAIITLLAAVISPYSWGIATIGILFFIGAIVSATNDIAIDGYYMEALDQKQQEQFIGYRILAYRVAMMFGTGAIVTVGVKWSWELAFTLSALVMFLLTIYHIYALSKVEKVQNPLSHLLKNSLKIKPIVIIAIAISFVIFLHTFYKSETYKGVKNSYPVLKKIYFSHWIGILLFISLVLLFVFKNRIKNRIIKNRDSFYAQSFLKFMDRDKIGFAIAFIIFIRTGEFLLHAMVPTFIVDLGIKEHYGWISAGVGLPASIFGALIGGALISKYGFKKMGFALLLIQNLTNVAYMVIAFNMKHYISLNTGVQNIENIIPIGLKNLVIVASVNGFEQFSAGLGTAVLTTYLLKVCMKKYKTSHFAIGTGLMNVSGALAGVAGGFLTGALGYGYFFGISFILSIPGMIIYFYIPHYDQDKYSIMDTSEPKK